jgi:hypothetical protein
MRTSWPVPFIVFLGVLLFSVPSIAQSRPTTFAGVWKVIASDSDHAEKIGNEVNINPQGGGYYITGKTVEVQKSSVFSNIKRGIPASPGFGYSAGGGAGF